ncbi:SDR family NAD(P)-dependent oxidoreductase [Dactylosporangium fulvum]|uniref:SDR family oxidoreductase n=1 Tax=Dactylosporangium fulvum TaxID=53359 RepID=A0ABY5W567_9ACTN|nr:SDR family oxidoreductase [Dactylosporangium fulvum]UWP85208.1 SDR family oxidoreductase [Dactylosporangium fulvum]
MTAAGSGIGRATAELFAARGFAVIAVDTDPGRLAEVSEVDGVTPLLGDVAEEETNREMVALAVRRHGRLDVAVLNAGAGGAPPLEHGGAIAALDAIHAVNVRGAALGIRAAVPALRAAGGGAVVVTASVAGLRGDPYTWAYNTTKAAAVNLVRSAALDYAYQGIRINAIAPGLTLTARTAAVHEDAERARELSRRIPLGRWAEPREQAEVIWFLASPAASYITGAVLASDGGLSASNGIFFPPTADPPPTEGL